MANTTNYNWETPDDTDLVKDGAAAIRTLGNSIDTTTKNLNPETTTGDIAYRSATANTNTRLPIGTNGQILAVSAGVPAWINNDQGDITEVQAGTGISVASGTGPIPVVTNTVATAIDAKGDLIVGTGADTFSRLAVGTNGHTLVADSSTATGLAYAAPASGGWTSLATGTVSGSSTTVNITTTGYKQVVAYLKDATTDGAYFAQVRFNGDTGNNYNFIVSRQSSTTAVTNAASNATDAFYALGMTLKQDSADSFQVVTIQDPANTTTHKLATLQVIGRDSGNTYNMSASVVGQYLSTSAISSITFIPGANYSTGNYEIYGVK
jgi:hypothetical protein